MLGRKNGEGQAEHVSEDRHDYVDDTVYSDNEMSVEEFDDLIAALALSVTIVTITLGFLFNL
jgi:hypothetical protein